MQAHELSVEEAERGNPRRPIGSNQGADMDAESGLVAGEWQRIDMTRS